MKRIKYVFLMLISIALCSSCKKIDNYDEPKEILTGQLIDQVSGRPLNTEQPNGFRIKLEETSWNNSPQPEYFWGKSDGTFSNTKIFAGTYNITPVEGAFFDVTPKSVELKGSVNIEFVVTPYLTITKSEIKRIDATSIELTYTITRSKVGAKIIDSRVFVSNNPNVGANIMVNELSPIKDLQSIADEVVLSTTFKETIVNLKQGVTYYVRVGARTDNPSKRYNFTEIVKLVN